MPYDYLGKFGCCLSCNERGKCHDPCYNCKCNNCDRYIKKEHLYNGAFYITKNKNKCSYCIERYAPVSFDEDFLDIICETEKAILIERKYVENWKYKNKNQFWLPKSQIRIINREPLKIEVPKWLCEIKGLMFDFDWEATDGLTFKQFDEIKLKTKYNCRDYENYNYY